ncbi:MAG: hypothetical protein BWZ03_00730 [bacterium ADurb.BinA186]|nr:MAG: hypothetical protein BWZ03_00730 [bacterium ADurb.BinA186]
MLIQVPVFYKDGRIDALPLNVDRDRLKKLYRLIPPYHYAQESEASPISFEPPDYSDIESFPKITNRRFKLTMFSIGSSDVPYFGYVEE